MVNFQVQMLYLIRRFSSKRDVEIRWMSSQNFATIKCLTVSPSMRHGSAGSSRAGSKSKLRKEHRSEIPKKRCGMGLEEAIHVIKDMNQTCFHMFLRVSGGLNVLRDCTIWAESYKLQATSEFRLLYIYIYPRGLGFTGNSCPYGVYIYEVGVGWGGDGNVPCTCTVGWGW